jgi:hypothetical protein
MKTNTGMEQEVHQSLEFITTSIMNCFREDTGMCKD